MYAENTMDPKTDGFETFCRGCLIHYDKPNELIQYTEKTRRQFVYATGLQVKRNDTFTLQLCKDCYVNMKMTCKFRKQCRTSDKRYKHYLALKEAGETADFFSFLKKFDDTFRFPFLNGYSTPMHQKSKDDDNESTTTSIRNFMTDMLKAEQIPETEVNIIREVIEEEADILDDSLDSQWLQDDATIDTDFNLDFSFSPFATPYSTNNDQNNSSKKEANRHVYVPTSFSPFKTPSQVKEKVQKGEVQEHVYVTSKNIVQIISDQEESFIVSDGIDKNLQKALKEEVEEFALDDLLISPASTNTQLATPTINDLLFGDKTFVPTGDGQTSVVPKDEQCIESFVIEKEDDLEQLLKDAADVNFYGSLDIKIDPLAAIDEPKCNAGIETQSQDDGSNKALEQIMDEDKQDDQEESLIRRENQQSRKNKQLFPSFLCYICADTFYDRDNYRKHILIHKEKKNQGMFICDICKRIFSSKSKIGLHMRCHIVDEKGRRKILQNFDNPPKKVLVCDICGAKTANSSNLKVHKRRHEKKYTVFCSECNKGFVRRQDCDKHMRAHTAQKPFACMQCNRKYASPEALNAHVGIRHTDERHFECEYCHDKFARKNTLVQHIKSFRCLKIRSGGFKDSNYPYECEHCHATFKMSCNLLMHTMRNKRCKRIREGIVEEERPKRKYTKKKNVDQDENTGRNIVAIVRRPKRKYTKNIVDEDANKCDIDWKPWCRNEKQKKSKKDSNSNN